MHDTSEGGESPLLMIDHKNEPEAETKQSTRSTKYNPWSKEEVLKLWSLVPTLGNSYRRYMPHFPSRSYCQIKSQFHNLKKREQRYLSRKHSDGAKETPQAQDELDVFGNGQW